MDSTQEVLYSDKVFYWDLSTFISTEFSSDKFILFTKGLPPSPQVCSNPWFFGDNTFSKKYPNGVKSWKQLRLYIALHNIHIYTDEYER